MQKQNFSKRMGCGLVGLVVVGIVIVLGWMVSVPWNVSNIASRPNPVASYAEALTRIDAWHAQESADMNPVCRLQSMTHGSKVARVIVLVHGYTNCPQQFHDLGQRYFDLGYNVLITPLPHHGLTDRMTEAHALMTTEELATYTDTSIDIARGLGDQVTVMGISAGGVIAAWAAQTRNDVDVAVIIAPGFGINFIPAPLTAAAMNLFGLAPNIFEWWDPTLQLNTTPNYGYPQFSTHALTQVLRLGFATRALAQNQPPAAKQLIVVSNANDPAVNSEMNKAMVTLWQAHGANLSTYEFDASLKMEHDIIDPTSSKQQIDVVYPRLVDLVNR